MASEIHKKRTGKAFRISEDIVVKEEMYEEEEDEFPRSYRLLGPHMQTSSPEMNLRVEAYLSSKVAMSKLVASTNDEWQQNEVNRMFAKSFPNVGRRLSQQTNQASPGGFAGQTNQNHGVPPSPLSTDFQSVNYTRPSMSPVDTRQSVPPFSPDHLTSPSIPHTPVLSATSDFDNAMAAGSAMDFGGGQSAFTQELPTEAKMLMGGMSGMVGMDGLDGMDVNDSWGPSFYGQNWDMSQLYEPSDLSTGDTKMNDMTMMSPPPLDKNDPQGSINWDQGGKANAMDEPVWDSFLNDSFWVGEQ